MAKILFDARLAGITHAGLGRYSEELLRTVLGESMLKHHDMVIVLRKRNQVPWLEKVSENNSHVRLLYVNIQHYSLLEQVLLPFVYWKEQSDLIHVPHFNLPLLSSLLGSYKKVITIHDLLWHKNKQNTATTLTPLVHFFKHALYVWITNTVMKHVEYILCPSNYVKSDILQLHPALRDKVEVVPIGVQELWFKPVKNFSIQLPSQNFLVYIGSAYPHKNIPYLLEVVHELKDDTSLVILSARSVFLDGVKNLVDSMGLQSRVQILHKLEDEQIKYVLSRSSGFITMSLSEGFGLPALEAMAVGVPVFASDIPIFREVYGSHPCFLPVDDSRRAAQILKHHLRKPIFNRNKQIGFVKKYSWTQAARDTVRVYEKLLK